MKKVFLALAVVATLGFVSCNKNYAEKYEGSYLVDVFTESTLLQHVTHDTVLATPMNIVLDGEEGDVLIQFLGSDDFGKITFQGTADKKGLHIKSYTSETTSENNTATYVFSETVAQLDKDQLTWDQKLDGRIIIPDEQIDWTITADRHCIATKQK